MLLDKLDHRQIRKCSLPPYSSRPRRKVRWPVRESNISFREPLSARWQRRLNVNSTKSWALEFKRRLSKHFFITHWPKRGAFAARNPLLSSRPNDELRFSGGSGCRPLDEECFFSFRDWFRARLN